MVSQIISTIIIISMYTIKIYVKYFLVGNLNLCHVREGADKSLARPGKKQATATKLGIY